MLISQGMNAQLNAQITAELSAAQTYLAMACNLDEMGLKVLGKLFFGQGEEERGHATRILRYVQEVGGRVTLEALPKPKADYTDAKNIIAAALKNEQDISARINDLVGLADGEKDYATRSFLNWFVDEQVEEVSSMIDLLNLVELADGNMLQVESRVRHEMSAGTGS